MVLSCFILFSKTSLNQLFKHFLGAPRRTRAPSGSPGSPCRNPQTLHAMDKYATDWQIWYVPSGVFEVFLASGRGWKRPSAIAVHDQAATRLLIWAWRLPPSVGGTHSAAGGSLWVHEVVESHQSSICAQNRVMWTSVCFHVVFSPTLPISKFLAP